MSERCSCREPHLRDWGQLRLLCGGCICICLCCACHGCWPPGPVVCHLMQMGLPGPKLNPAWHLNCHYRAYKLGGSEALCNGMATTQRGPGMAVLPCMLGCTGTLTRAGPQGGGYTAQCRSVWCRGQRSSSGHVTVTAYLAASLSVWPLSARERAAAHRVRSALTCMAVYHSIHSCLEGGKLHWSRSLRADLLLQVCWPWKYTG